MVIPSIFELNSIKDQISLIRAITSHIDFEEYENNEKELEPDYQELLQKLDKSAKNLQEKYENLKKLLDN